MADKVGELFDHTSLTAMYALTQLQHNPFLLNEKKQFQKYFFTTRKKHHIKVTNDSVDHGCIDFKRDIEI